MRKYIYVLFLFLLYLNSKGQNTSNFSGSFDVGPAGNATYNIPVDLPPGTAGMSPQVSIVYNSFSNDGVMGKGFSISATSSITRVNSTMFHGGYFSDIKFDASDKYMLDGNRLMSMGIPGEFRTEINPNSQIKIYSANTSTAYFEVKTKEGFIMEYGKTVDSRLCSQSTDNKQVAFWMINKVSDRFGNYYTYTYEKNEDNGEIRLKQIDYTGNTALPYYSVKFNYSNRNYDVNLNYIGGSKFKESKLLSDISIYYGTSLYKKYNMTYSFDVNDYTYLLSKINVTGRNNEVLKPITFNWYKNTDFKQTQVIYDQSTNAVSYVNQAYITPGDFNGDGRTDFIASPKPDANWSGWRLFLASPDGNKFTYSGTGALPDGFKEIIPGDFNGDGITDFIGRREYVNKAISSDSLSLDYDNDGSILTFESNDSAKSRDTLGISNEDDTRASTTYQNYFVYYGTGSGFTPGPAITTESKPHGVRVADFNGDGAMDLFIYYTEKKGAPAGYKICMSEYSSGKVEAFKITKTGPITTDTNWDMVEVWDFNGDGLAEVINLKEDGYDYYENNGAGSMWRSRSSNFPNKKHKISFGDFNGDRKIDMLLTGWDGKEWSEWQTLLSTGTGFERFYFPKKFNTFSKEIFVCDLNGDGCDDFFAVDNTSSGMNPLKCYIGYDNGRNFKEYSSVNTYDLEKWHFYPLDTRGDGKLGFLVTSATYSWKGYQLYMPKAEFTNLLQSMIDSHGNKTEVTYKNMADASVYTKTLPAGGSATVTDYDCLSFVSPFKLVSNVSISNGIGGMNSVSYSYENAKIFKRGRGFLGFAKMSINDLITSIKTSVNQEFSNMYYQAAVKSIEKVYTPTNRKLMQKDYVNALITNSNIYGTFSFLPSMETEQLYEPAANKLVQSVTTSYSYDIYGNVLIESSKHGNGDVQKRTNIYSNNTTDWLIGLLTESKTESIVNNKTQTNVAQRTYNSNGSVYSQIIEPNSSEYKSIEEYKYDKYGNIIEKTKKVGNTVRTESYTYKNGRFPDTYTNELGQTESFTYDDLTGLLGSKTNINGEVETYKYDGFGKVKEQIKSSMSGNTFVVNWSWTNGSPVNSVVLRTETSGDGQVLKTWYNSLGKELQTSHKNFLGNEVYSTVTFDAQGRPLRKSDPYYSGSSSSSILYQTFQYDSYGRTSKIITPKGTISYNYSGNLTTIEDGTKGYKTVQETDMAGQLIKVTDPGGVISYVYGPSGNPVNVTVCDSIKYALDYDIFGRRKTLKDPNAGTISYAYDGWGNLISQTNGRGEKEEYTYDKNGLLLSYKRGNEPFTYTYDDVYKDKVKSIYYGAVKTDFEYGDFGRLLSKTEIVDNRPLKYLYNYNNKGQLETTTYPNSKSVKYEYAYGNLYKIIWNPGNITVWKKDSENAKGQILSATLGNGIQEIYSFNAIGIPTSIQAKKGSSYLMNVSYPDIDTRGNIKERKDLIKLPSERFDYDDMNRLITDINYSGNGNIMSKSNVGTFQYDLDQPHAVKSITLNSYTGWSNADLSVTYNTANMPVEIMEENKAYTLTYNGQNTRVKSSYKVSNSTIFTKYYCGPYEEIHKGSTIQKNYYIYTGGKIAAVYTEGTSDAGMYYFHNDHLGSPWVITNSSGTEVQRMSFDAWGRRRNIENWRDYTGLTEFKFDRGFTGHEHLDMFGLINMNARLYDPVLGRFLSPDPVVQIPNFTQSYNGYTYALNNPLLYTDPNGEFFTALIPGLGVFLDAMIVGAIVGTVGGGVKSAIQGQGFWSGAWKGAIVGGVGGLMAPIGGAGMSFAANVGLGAAQGTLVGGLDAALWGTSVGKGMLWGCISGASFSALTSDNMKNWVKGKGFKSNNSVLKDFRAGKYTTGEGTWQQDALDYFGFEGTYDPNNEIFTKHGVNPGVTNPKTGEIFYHDAPFDGNYDYLKFVGDHEGLHSKNVLSGKYKGVDITVEVKGVEEWSVYMNNYKNQGLYPNHGVTDLVQRISEYGINAGFYGPQITPGGYSFTDFNVKPWHIIYKIPRRW